MLCLVLVVTTTAFSQLISVRFKTQSGQTYMLVEKGVSLQAGANLNFLYDSIRQPGAAKAESTHVLVTLPQELCDSIRQSGAAMASGTIQIADARDTIVADVVNYSRAVRTLNPCAYYHGSELVMDRQTLMIDWGPTELSWQDSESDRKMLAHYKKDIDDFVSGLNGILSRSRQ